MKAPISKALIARYEPLLRTRQGLSSFSSSRTRGTIYFVGERWYRKFRVRNLEYIAPPCYQIVYGLPENFIVVRFPSELPFKKTVLPALQKLVVTLGSSFYPSKKIKDWRANLDGADEQIWKGAKDFGHYDWNKNKFVKVSQ